MFFMISLREIMKNMCLTKEYSAAEGGRRLFRPRIPKVNTYRQGTKATCEGTEKNCFKSNPGRPGFFFHH